MQFTGIIVVESESVAEPVDDYPVATVSPNRQTDLHWERRWQAPLGRGQNYRFPMKCQRTPRSRASATRHPILPSGSPPPM
jgi:hypothetical protein